MDERTPPTTRYAKSGDGTNIAYQVLGNGPVDLVFVPGWTSHLELDWEQPDIARFLRRLGAFTRVIRFDKRGTGLSDRVAPTELPPLEVRMDDLRAVMDAAGSSRAALLGYSEGGPMCILFAATYPERTSHLILYGTHASPSIEGDNYSIRARMAADPDAFVSEVEAQWGQGFGLDHFAPDLKADPTLLEALGRRQRASASPAAAATLARMSMDSDVASVLELVSVPTLVIHRCDDQAVGVAHGRMLAERIPSARYVELEGDVHYPYLGDSEAIVGAIEECITGQRASAVHDRVLATVLFTDIVGSTTLAGDLGDLAWRNLLERFRANVRRLLEQYRGREVNTRGDDFLATFDGPARAITCALAIRDAAHAIGVEVRSGLHTGEVELMGSDIAGMAVHVGARIAASANSHEVVVSRTVTELVTGSGLSFVPRGEYQLKGVPGSWQLFAVGG